MLCCRTHRLWSSLLLLCLGINACGALTSPVEVEHRVHIHETLSDIAVRFDVPGGWAALAEHNHLPSPDVLSPEQILRVPVDHLLARGEDPRQRMRPPPPQDVAPVERACAVTVDTLPRHEPAAQACQPDERCGVFCVPVGDGFLCEEDREVRHQDALAVGDQRLAVDGSDDDPYATRVHRVDLDGDGSPEWVVVRYEGTSNGIALLYYRVDVLDILRGTQSQTMGNGVSFAATQAVGCELRLHDFGYAEDLDSGATHAYWIEYPLAWDGRDLVPAPGGWFQRWSPTDTRTFRAHTERSRPAPEVLEPLGTITAIQRGPWSLQVEVRPEAEADGEPETVELYASTLLGIGDEVAARSALDHRSQPPEVLVGRQLWQAAGTYWVEGQGSSIKR